MTCTGCKICSAGFYSPAVGRDSCLAAPTGRFVSQTGAIGPVDCPWRQFQDQVAQTSCKACFIPACTMDTAAIRSESSTAAAIYQAPFSKLLTAFEARWACQFPAARYNLEALALGELASASTSSSTSFNKMKSLSPSSSTTWIGAHQRAAFGPGSFSWVDGEGGQALLSRTNAGSLFGATAQFDHSLQCAALNGATNQLVPFRCDDVKTGGMCQIRKLGGTCPSGWIRAAMSNNCFKANPSSVSWAGAASACTEMNPNAKLAEFASSLEVYWAQTLAAPLGNRDFWIAARQGELEWELELELELMNK